jgi:predicted MFS family arabinose efflux permease
MINYGARPLGALTGGVLGTWLGLRPTLVLAGVGGALCCLWLLPSPIPRLRSLDALQDGVSTEVEGMSRNVMHE